jgi:hypothetical protein
MSAPFRFLRRPLRGLVVMAAAAALVACGSDDDDDSSVGGSTLGGVAAVGAPIVGGTVDVSCAGGTPLNTTTGDSGQWQVAISGQTLPCAVQVSGGTVGVGGAANALALHSLAVEFGNLNVTPLTDLVVASRLGRDPQAWFAAPVFAGIDAASLDAAATRIVAALGIGSTLGTRNPLTARFEPVAGDPIDDVLEALDSALQALGQGYAALLTAAGTDDFAAFAGLPGAVASALGSGGGGGGSTSCSSGVQMTFASGLATGPFTDGQKACVEASPTSLKIDSKTFTNPTQNTNVSPPYSGYVFADAGLNYEVVFNNGALYEINIGKPNALSAADFHGQFTPTAGSGGVTMTLEVGINGVVASSIPVPNQTVPAGQAEFCADIANDPNLTGVQVQGGVTLTITDCSFANNTGTVNATAQTGGITVPYVVRFIYGS